MTSALVLRHDLIIHVCLPHWVDPGMEFCEEDVQVDDSWSTSCLQQVLQMSDPESSLQQMAAIQAIKVGTETPCKQASVGDTKANTPSMFYYNMPYPALLHNFYQLADVN